jgi:hypothetical protein
VKAAREDFLQANLAAEGGTRGLKERLDEKATGEDGRPRVMSCEQVLVVEAKMRLEGACHDRSHPPMGSERRWPHADTIMTL